MRNFLPDLVQICLGLEPGGGRTHLRLHVLDDAACLAWTAVVLEENEQMMKIWKTKMMGPF